MLTFKAVRQPTGVVYNSSNALVDTDERSLDVAGHIWTKKRSVSNWSSALLCRECEEAVLSFIVVDKHIPAQGQHLHHGNAVIQGSKSPNIPAGISKRAHYSDLKMFAGVDENRYCCYSCGEHLGPAKLKVDLAPNRRHLHLQPHSPGANDGTCGAEIRILMITVSE